MRILPTSLFVLLSNVMLWGQESRLDFFQSSGKIYAVVACIVAIFIGIVLFLIKIDRNLTKLEQHIKDD